MHFLTGKPNSPALAVISMGPCPTSSAVFMLGLIRELCQF